MGKPKKVPLSESDDGSGDDRDDDNDEEDFEEGEDASESDDDDRSGLSSAEAVLARLIRSSHDGDSSSKAADLAHGLDVPVTAKLFFAKLEGQAKAAASSSKPTNKVKQQPPPVAAAERRASGAHGPPAITSDDTASTASVGVRDAVVTAVRDALYGLLGLEQAKAATLRSAAAVISEESKEAASDVVVMQWRERSRRLASEVFAPRGALLRSPQGAAFLTRHAFWPVAFGHCLHVGSGDPRKAKKLSDALRLSRLDEGLLGDVADVHAEYMATTTPPVAVTGCKVILRLIPRALRSTVHDEMQQLHKKGTVRIAPHVDSIVLTFSWGSKPVGAATAASSPLTDAASVVASARVEWRFPFDDLLVHECSLDISCIIEAVADGRTLLTEIPVVVAAVGAATSSTTLSAASVVADGGGVKSDLPMHLSGIPVVVGRAEALSAGSLDDQLFLEMEKEKKALLAAPRSAPRGDSRRRGDDSSPSSRGKADGGRETMIWSLSALLLTSPQRWPFRLPPPEEGAARSETPALRRFYADVFSRLRLLALAPTEFFSGYWGTGAVDGEEEVEEEDVSDDDDESTVGRAAAAAKSGPQRATHPRGSTVKAALPVRGSKAATRRRGRRSPSDDSEEASSSSDEGGGEPAAQARRIDAHRPGASRRKIDSDVSGGTAKPKAQPDTSCPQQ